MQQDVDSRDSSSSTESKERVVAKQTASIDLIVAGQSSHREPRSIDAFLDEAYEDKANGTKWKYWIVMLSLGLSNSSESAEILCVGFLLSDPSFQSEMLGVNWHGSLLASCVFVGMLTGTLFVGALGDAIGRRPMMRVGLATIALLGILSSLSLNIYQLVFLRALTGVGIGSMGPPMLAMASELAPPSRRGLFITVVSSFWIVGSVFVSLVAYMTLASQQQTFGNWRWFLVVAAFPSTAASLLVSLLVVESPRFQALHQRQEDAVVSIQLLAQQMRYSGPPLTIEEILYHYPKATETTVTTTPGAAEGGGGGAYAALRQEGSSWSQIYKTIGMAFVIFGRSSLKLYHKKLLRTTILLQIVWIGLCFGSNGIAIWITRLFQAVHLSNIYWNAVLFALAQIPGSLLTVLLIDWTSRQRVLSIGFLGAAVSLLVFAYFANSASSSSSTVSSLGVVGAACAFQACIQVAWNTMSVVTTERFPTVVRATAWAVLSSSGKISGAVANFVNGFLVSWPAMLLLLASVSMVIAGTTPFALEGIPSRALEDDILTNDTQEGIEIGQDRVPVVAAVGGDNDNDAHKQDTHWKKTSINGRGDVSYQSI